MKTVTLVACMGENGAIGLGGQLPWQNDHEISHIRRADMQHFKTVTMGRTVIMGRKTYDSLPRALYGRRMVVVSRRADYSLERAIRENYEPIIIGGGEIYRAALPYATYIDLTVLDKRYDGDTFFPELDKSWEITSVANMERRTCYLYRRVEPP